MKDYNEVRDQLNTGDVVLFHRQEGWRGLVGWLISHITGSPFTHCGMVICLEYQLFLIEAKEGQGVVIRLLREVKQPFKIFLLGHKADDEESLNIALTQKLGSRYDWLGAALAIFKLSRKNSKWFCSEFIRNIWVEQFSYQHSLMLGLDNVFTPADINNHLEKFNNIPNFWVNAPKSKNTKTSSNCQGLA